VKKLAIFLLFVLCVFVAVCYSVRTLPRAGGPLAPDSSSGTGAARLPPLGPACGTHCGTERWLVKTLADPDRACVSLAPVNTTIEELIALDAPSHRPDESRIRPVECTVYRVRAHLAAWDSLFVLRHERDGDYHLVLYGLQDPRAHLIAEMPDPACPGACQSGLGEQFAVERAALLAQVRDPGSPMGQNPDAAVVVVTGVGFFDRPHNQTGHAPNNFELHPVLSITFLPLDSSSGAARPR